MDLFPMNPISLLAVSHNAERGTPYSLSDPDHSYARRLLLMSAVRHNPTRDLDGAASLRLITEFCNNL